MRGATNPGLMILAVVIAVFLWGVAHGSASIELGFDVPVALKAVPETLVSTELSSDAINIRVRGTRASLRNLDPQKLEYAIDVSGAKPGRADFEVEVSRLEMPRGSRIVSRSPAEIEVRFEPRGSKSVAVRAESSGEPAVGYRVASLNVEPGRVRITGARRAVQRVNEVATEPIDLTGISASAEREVRLSPAATHVWLEAQETVKVRIVVEPTRPEAAEGQEGAA